MLNLLSTSVILSLSIPIILFVLTRLKNSFKTPFCTATKPTNPPNSLSLFASLLAILKNKERFIQWTSEMVNSTPTLTLSLYRDVRRRIIITANPDVVRHILKSHFHNYGKGELFRAYLKDLLGDGIFNSDGEKWKFQRQVASHEFSTRSLRKFVETVVDSQISLRLIPIMEDAKGKEKVLDFQDILQRFTFDNICKIAFGYDPEYLSPSLPQEKFAVAFETAVKLSGERFVTFIPYSWRIKKALNIGSEKQLKIAVREVREFAKNVVREKRREIGTESSPDQPADDLLSRFLISGHTDEDFVTDIVISFILAGRDTTSAALTWFFWLLSEHPQVENEILKEIKGKPDAASATTYDEAKEMVYTHASLCESMRLYPPVPLDTKEALNDDVLPDGTMVKKGMRVSYHPYIMGRAEKVWGEDWAEFRPERWLERNAGSDKWNFVNRDAYTYTVFQVGTRICPGKDMAFIQMKRVVAAILQRFRVVPKMAAGTKPVFVAGLTAKMKDGFPVRIQARPV